MIRTLAKKSSQYFVWMVVAKIASTSAFLLFGRVLGASEFGQFLYWPTIIQIVTVFADVGTTHWQQTQVEHARAFGKAIRLRAVTLGISGILITTSATFFSNLSMWMILLLLIALFSDALLAISDGYYLAQGKGQMLSMKVLSKTIVTLIFFFLFGYQTAIFALLAYILGNFVTAFWSLPWKALQHNTVGSSVLSTFRLVRPYALLIATSFTYARADSFLVGRVVGPEALGNYGAAYRYLEGVSMLPTAIGQVLFPLSAREKNLDWGFFRPLLVISLFIGVSVGSALILFSNLLTVWLLGDSYSLAESVLQIFAVVSVLFFINAPLATLIQSSKKVSEFLPFGIANTMLNVLVNLYVIPRYGALGAAYTMLLTELTGMLINIYFIRKIALTR